MSAGWFWTQDQEYNFSEWGELLLTTVIKSWAALKLAFAANLMFLNEHEERQENAYMWNVCFSMVICTATDVVESQVISNLFLCLMLSKVKTTS